MYLKDQDTYCDESAILLILLGFAAQMAAVVDFHLPLSYQSSHGRHVNVSTETLIADAGTHMSYNILISQNITMLWTCFYYLKCTNLYCKYIF